MPTTYRPYAPEQDLLLQPSLREWLADGHLSYFISDVIEELDLGAFYECYEGDGRRKAPFEPRMMLKVLIYGYATGVFSSRKIAKKLEEDVAFRLLAADNFPQHRTLCDFRKRHRVGQTTLRLPPESQAFPDHQIRVVLKISYRLGFRRNRLRPFARGSVC